MGSVCASGIVRTEEEGFHDNEAELQRGDDGEDERAARGSIQGRDNTRTVRFGKEDEEAHLRRDRESIYPNGTLLQARSDSIWPDVVLTDNPPACWVAASIT